MLFSISDVSRIRLKEVQSELNARKERGCMNYQNSQLNWILNIFAEYFTKSPGWEHISSWNTFVRIRPMKYLNYICCENIFFTVATVKKGISWKWSSLNEHRLLVKISSNSEKQCSLLKSTWTDFQFSRMNLAESVCFRWKWILGEKTRFFSIFDSLISTLINFLEVKLEI